MRNTRRAASGTGRVRLAVPVLVVTLALAGCDAGEPVIDPGDGGNYSVRLDPADFVATIDNPWLPFTPGSRWVYQAGEGERNEVVVTDQTRTVMGIRATVVRDTETRDGALVEDTFDWFARTARATSGTWARPPGRSGTASCPRPGPGRRASTAPCPGSS